MAKYFAHINIGPDWTKGHFEDVGGVFTTDDEANTRIKLELNKRYPNLWEGENQFTHIDSLGGNYVLARVRVEYTELEQLRIDRKYNIERLAEIQKRIDVLESEIT